MKHEWKPGDVAVVKVDGKKGTYVGLRDTHGWATNRTDRHRSHAHWTNAAYVTPIRPLVVIDPEDRAQVDRLGTIRDEMYERMHPDEYDNTPEIDDDADTDLLQAALREFANPTPPKPEEPTGLGAVVEDADGLPWTRANEDGEWYSADGEEVALTYAEVNAVRVLSEGWSA